MLGFTFTELLICLVILGLLAGFGLPALLQHNMQSRLATARETLKRIAGQQSQWFAGHRGYAGLNQLGYPVDSGLAAIYLDEDGSISGHGSGKSIYRITVRLGTPSALGNPGTTAAYYLITAQPINDQAKDSRCGTLSLASTGQVGATGTQGEAGCWH